MEELNIMEDVTNKADELTELLNKKRREHIKIQESDEFSNLEFIESLYKINNKYGNESGHLIMRYLTIIARNTIEIKHLLKTALFDIQSK